MNVSLDFAGAEAELGRTYLGKVVRVVNFGAFVGFILVNLSVIRHYYIRLGERRGVCLFTNLLFPLAGALVCSYVWMSLTGKAKLVGFGWLLAGVLYLAVLTRGFRVAPKKLEFS